MVVRPGTCAVRAAAAASIIPTRPAPPGRSGLVLPATQGQGRRFRLRVPTINVSLVDLPFAAERPTAKEEINEARGSHRQRPAQRHPRGRQTTAGLPPGFQPPPRVVHLRQRHPDTRHRRARRLGAGCWPGMTTGWGATPAACSTRARLPREPSNPTRPQGRPQRPRFSFTACRTPHMTLRAAINRIRSHQPLLAARAARINLPRRKLSGCGDQRIHESAASNTSPLIRPGR